MAAVIGVLTLQGDFARHLLHLSRSGARPRAVRTVEEMRDIDGLVIPGGESTTIGKLMDRYDLLDTIRDRIEAGMPVYGTCAGAILLARRIVDSRQHRLGVMDITVSRNAYGRQVESFEANLEVPALGDEPLRGVFIRAPVIEETGDAVSVMSTFEGRPVLVRQNTILAGTFHPELTQDLRVHSYFLDMICERLCRLFSVQFDIHQGNA